MSRPFRFKEFTIEQAINPQKVGTDSMLLGAWAKADAPKRILDIGTGTGILALMMAQRFPKAHITAIEPDLPSLQEAQRNFSHSPFSHQIMAIHARIQAFGALEKFDLIISNPPYFEAAFLSDDIDRNRARHTNDLPIHEFYEQVDALLSASGKLAIVVPHDLETTHLERAAQEGLYPQTIIRTIRPDGGFKRSLMAFGRVENPPTVSSLAVKDENNRYSADYIALTRDFYEKDLSQF